MVQTAMGIDDIHNYYDTQRGWEGTNPGWYEVILHVTDSDATYIRYRDTIEWLKDNISGYKKHCRWYYGHTVSVHYTKPELKYKFRYERDYIWFKLTWG